MELPRHRFDSRREEADRPSEGMPATVLFRDADGVQVRVEPDRPASRQSSGRESRDSRARADVQNVEVDGRLLLESEQDQARRFVAAGPKGAGGGKPQS